jgi:hypothetical protein
MARVKRCFVLLAGMLSAACSGPGEFLTVKQFQLRDVKDSHSDDPMVRNEKLRRLHGAISMEERGQRLGQYYTVQWEDPEGAGAGVPEVVFEYQQGGSASRIKRLVRRFQPADAAGVAEFAIIGDDYFRNGRVLTWRVTLRRGTRVLATRQSYLWQSRDSLDG